MERSFKQEVELLKLGDGDTFHGEGILAVTKALLQSGVSYVGGYQGAPVSHVMDVLNDARDILDELGVHVETNASEAGAAAMLGASINYPMRGAVAFKSTVGTNVASDALSNLASAGVRGGALLVLGEDYGEGSSIIQERTHAFAMKSQIWLLDPRPNLPKIVEMVEQGFELSEASNTPVMLELRIRACHVHGSFRTKNERAPAISKNNASMENPDFDFGRICLPPATYAQEKHKIEVRWPAAVAFIRKNKLNEVFAGDMADTGILCQGGMYNAVIRALQLLGLADAFGATRVPIYCMNVAYPMIPEEIVEFCAGKKRVLVVEEGQPAFIEDAVQAALRRAERQRRQGARQGHAAAGGRVHGRSRIERDFAVPEPGKGNRCDKGAQGKGAATARRRAGPPARILRRLPGAAGVRGDEGRRERDRRLPHLRRHRLPHCSPRCRRSTSATRCSATAWAWPRIPRSTPCSASARVTIMGDGGFWHNGLTSGIANSVFNKDDGILVIMKNGYSSATGTQELPSSPQHSEFKSDDMAIERALEGVGVGWVKTVDNYRVGDVAKVLKEAMSTDYKGLKVIIAEGECQLERQRKLRPVVAKNLAEGKRTRAGEIRRRRGHLHRRPLLHPALGLPDAHHQGQPGPAAARPGGHRDRRLRRLRPVRRERARRRAVPVVLPGGSHSKP